MRKFVLLALSFVILTLSAACATTKPVYMSPSGHPPQTDTTDDDLTEAKAADVRNRWVAPPNDTESLECAGGCHCDERGYWINKDGKPDEINGVPIHCKPNIQDLQPEEDAFYLPGFGHFLCHKGRLGDTNAGHGFRQEGKLLFCPFKPGCFVPNGKWTRSEQEDEVCLDASLCVVVEKDPCSP